MIFFYPMSMNEKKNHNRREDYILHFRILLLMRDTIFKCFLRIKTMCLRQIFSIFIYHFESVTAQESVDGNTVFMVMWLA